MLTRFVIAVRRDDVEQIGFNDLVGKLHQAIDVCGQYEKKLLMPGRETGATSFAFGEYLMRTVEDPNLEGKWNSYVKAG